MVALEVRDVGKRFPGVQALSGVSASFEAGRCHALVGENGAGKSTLGKILAGLYRPDAGEIFVNGRPASFGSPLDAQRAGIGIVHQELLFCENLSVAENLTLAAPPRRGPFVDRAAMRARAIEQLDAVEAQVDPDALIGSLPIAKRQLVQIAGALGAGARILIFDEPTSSLGGAETARLLACIRDLLSRGVTCVYVSHRMDEVYEACDTATVLRDGAVVGTVSLAETPREALVSMMIGRSVEPFAGVRAGRTGEPLLEVSNLSSPPAFEGIGFSLARGEILGIGGLVGAGRTEVLEALFGLRQATGEVRLSGTPLALGTPGSQARLGLVPEDRKRHGLVLSMNCRENISLPFLDRLCRAGFVRSGEEYAVARRYFGRMRVKAPSVDTASALLSGGNQQKLVLAKWLGANCEVLLVDEPTRGVDVGGKEEIHALLRELAAEGKGVLVVSSELPELLALSDRVLILRAGRLAGEAPTASATEASLMRLMAGVA